MPVELPNASRAATACFNNNFSTLPDEVKLITIRHTVSIKGTIWLENYMKTREDMTAPFKGDDDLLAVAYEQFDCVNTFKMASADPEEYKRPAMNVRHLQVCFTLRCTGGELHNFSNPLRHFKLPANDIMNLKDLTMNFTRLERLDVIIDNTGEFTRDTRYTCLGVPTRRTAYARAVERMTRMSLWIDLVSGYELPRWHKELKPEKKLIFVQTMPYPEHYRAYFDVTADDPETISEEEYLKQMYAIHDAPIAECRVT